MSDQLTTYQKKKRAELLKAIQVGKPALAADKEEKLDSFLNENKHILEEESNQVAFGSEEISLEELNANTINHQESLPVQSSIAGESKPQEVVDYSYQKPVLEEREAPQVSELVKAEIAEEQEVIKSQFDEAIQEVGDIALNPITDQVQKIVDEREAETKQKKTIIPKHLPKINLPRVNPVVSAVRAVEDIGKWVKEVDETAEIQQVKEERAVPITREELVKDLKGVSSTISKVSIEQEIGTVDKVTFFIKGVFEVLAYRVFKPVEAREEYNEAFMDEGEIDEVYSLSITRQSLVISGMFILMLMIFALFERVLSSFLPFVMLRELIFIIPLAILYVVVYKFHNRIYLNNLYPLSIMIGGVLELAVAGIFIVNTYFVSSVLSVLIAAFFMYFGITRLDFDLKKISWQISPPDKDKECPNCQKLVPKGENYCNVCDTNVY